MCVSFMTLSVVQFSHLIIASIEQRYYSKSSVLKQQIYPLFFQLLLDGNDTFKPQKSGENNSLNLLIRDYESKSVAQLVDERL